MSNLFPQMVQRQLVNSEKERQAKTNEELSKMTPEERSNYYNRAMDAWAESPKSFSDVRPTVQTVSPTVKPPAQVVPRADRVSPSSVTPQPSKKKPLRDHPLSDVIYAYFTPEGFNRNPSHYRNQYLEFKANNKDEYDFSELDEIVRPWTPLEEVEGFGRSFAEGATWNAWESDRNVGHWTTQFAGNLAGSFIPGLPIYRYAGAPILGKIYKSPLGKKIGDRLGYSSPISGAGFVEGTKRVMQQAKQLRLPMSPLNVRRLQGMAGLSVPEAIVGGIAEGIREESFEEALSSMPYWFLIGVLGNTGFEAIKKAYRKYWTSQKASRKKTPQTLRAESNYKGRELDSEDSFSPQELTELTGIIEEEFQKKLGLTMGEFDQIIKDFSDQETDKLLDIISDTTLGTSSLEVPKVEVIRKYVNDVYKGRFLSQTGTERLLKNVVNLENELVNRELQVAARNAGTANSDVSNVKNLSKSETAFNNLSKRGLLPDFKKGERFDKETDWTQQESVPLEVYDSQKDWVLRNDHNEYGIDGPPDFRKEYDKTKDVEPKPPASLYMIDEINNNPEIREALWASRIESGEGRPTNNEMIDDFIEEQRPLVQQSKIIATLENNESVTTLEDGTVFKGTPEDYRLNLQKEFDSQYMDDALEERDAFGSRQIESEGEWKRSDELNTNLREVISNWLSNVTPVFSKRDSYFKNIKLIEKPEAVRRSVRFVIDNDDKSIQLGYNKSEPFLIINKEMIYLEYSMLKRKAMSFKEFTDDKIARFYGQIKRGPSLKNEVEPEAKPSDKTTDELSRSPQRAPLDFDEDAVYQKDITESVNLNKNPVTEDVNSGETFLHNNVKVVDDPNSPKAGTYNRENKTITINSKVIQDKFDEKSWTTPSMKDVQALPKNSFENVEQWRDFILEHEYLHHEFSYEDFKKTWENLSNSPNWSIVFIGKPKVPTKADYENYINANAYFKVTGKELDLLLSVDMRNETWKNKDGSTGSLKKGFIRDLREILGLSSELKKTKEEIDSIKRGADIEDGEELSVDDVEKLFGFSGEDFDDLFDLPFKHSESDRIAFEAGVLPDNLDLNAPAHDLVKEKIVEQVTFLAKIDKSVFDETKISPELTNAEALYITDILHERMVVAEHMSVDQMLDHLDDVALAGTLVGGRDAKAKESTKVTSQYAQGRAVSDDPDMEVIETAEVLADELGVQATTWFGRNMEWLMGPDKQFGLSKNRYIRDLYVRYSQVEQDRMVRQQEILLAKYYKIRELVGGPKRSSVRNTTDKISVLLGRQNEANIADQKLYTLARYLDQDYTEGNNPLAKVPPELKRDENMYQAFLLYRELMDDVANILKLPKDKRISGYLAHIFHGKAGRLVGGKVSAQTSNSNIEELVKTLNSKIETEGRSLDEVLDALEVVMEQGLKGIGYRGLIKREGSENYTYNLDEITLAVIYGSTQKEFTHKLAKRANDVMANLPYTIVNKFGTKVENPMRKAMAKHARHMMGKPSSQREYIAQVFADSKTFNNGVDRIIELLGGAPEGLNLSLPKNATQSQKDNEMRKKSIEWLDELERIARIQDFKTGEPTQNLKNDPSKFIRASIALKIQDLRNALNNRNLSGPVANSIYRGLIVGKLGLNFSHAVLNLTQIINTASKLEMNYVKHGLYDTMYKRGKIHGRSINSIIEESGIKRDITSTEEYMGMRPSFIKDVQEKLLVGSRVTEGFNREVALLGAYRKYKDLGQSHSEALTKARLVVNETQHTFDRSGTPPFLRGPLMRNLMMFSSYTVHQTAFTVDLAKGFGREYKKLKADNEDWSSPKAFRKALFSGDGRGLMKFGAGTGALIAGAMGSDAYLDTDITYKVVPPMLSLPYEIMKDTGRRGLAGSIIENTQGPAGDLATHLMDGTESGLGYVYWTLKMHGINANDAAEKMWKNYSKVSTAFVPTSLKKVYNWDQYGWMEMAGLKNMSKRPKVEPVNNNAIKTDRKGRINSSMISSVNRNRLINRDRSNSR